MPVRSENRWLYPIDWAQLSHIILFDRAGSRCERPHLRHVTHLVDRRWWEGQVGCWRSDRGSG